jgi:hypothetical protein
MNHIAPTSNKRGMKVFASMGKYVSGAIEGVAAV